MNATARMSPPPMSSPSLEQDNERRFQPERASLDSFLRSIQPRLLPCVYDSGLPFAFTRTTYLDTERLDFLGSCRAGHTQRLRLREYAGTADLAAPPVLSGTPFLELKRNVGERRTKVRLPLSTGEAEALLSGSALPEASAAATLLRQAAPAPVKPWVTAWYQRSTLATPDAGVRITLDEGLVFALPPERSEPGAPAAPSRLLGGAPTTTLLEVKWRGVAPVWLERALWMLEPFETHGSKFEQGMRARFPGVRSTQ